MSIFLGNITFDQVRSTLGFELTEEDKALWNKYHNSKADLSGMDQCFHIFDIPRQIHIKGEQAKEAVLKIFAIHKLVEPMGTFTAAMVN